MHNPFEEILKRLDHLEILITSRAPAEVVQMKSNKPITMLQLCEHLGVTEPTILRWRKKGKIPFFKIGTAIRFNLTEVLKALHK